MSRTSESSTLLEGLESDQKSGAKSARAQKGGSSTSQRQLILGLSAFLVSIAVLGYVSLTAYKSWNESPLSQSRKATLKDSETGEVFEDFSTPSGESSPFVNPKTGKRTLFPAEACYWTKDGKAKFPPTFVILNERLGVSGATKCPDCGRNVRRFNPLPPDDLMQAAWDASQKK